eukprot:GHVR01015172.1.p1 GENE.GHVR01015172.1~~GHVR01015172.1.p1  ORF type:complete len:108 (+),score=0.19 GHVR01015172.1:871-1194(+)
MEVNVSLYTTVESNGYWYIGSNGLLTIRKNIHVYNYSPIPLNISKMQVFPGGYAGVQAKEFITIEGSNRKQTPLKREYNSMGNECYLYPVAYIVDYVGFLFDFDTKH